VTDVNWTEIISTLGFPIAVSIAMAVFIFKIYNDMKTDKEVARQENKANMEAVQARCKEREEKLYEEIKQNREVNAQAITTIAHYAEKFDVIQQDIHDIKNDISIIKASN
jgi:septal ring factor EnvC (AmiA/AmiB activator)